MSRRLPAADVTLIDTTDERAKGGRDLRPALDPDFAWPLDARQEGRGAAHPPDRRFRRAF
jgi:hypothetical protein